MIIGNPDLFAIESVIYCVTEGKIFIRFRIWINGCSYGDWDDWIYLHTSIANAKDYLKYSTDRDKSRKLNSQTSDELFKELYDSVIATEGVGNINRLFNIESINELMQTKGKYRDVYHFEEIGGTSLTSRYGIILVYQERSSERLIWMDQCDHSISEAVLPLYTVDKVLIEYCEWGEKMIRNIQ